MLNAGKNGTKVILAPFFLLPAKASGYTCHFGDVVITYFLLLVLCFIAPTVVHQQMIQLISN